MASEKDQSGPLQYQPFQDLGKVLELRKSPEPPPCPRKPAPPSDEEVFRTAMKEVSEIREFRNLPIRKKRTAPAQKAPSAREDIREELEEIVSGKSPLNLRNTQEYVEWADEACSRELLRKLREGGFSVQDCLDLHGCSLEQAEAEVGEFFRRAVQEKLRCIRIIHGRGLRSPRGPVIKQALLGWLTFRYRKHLMAFSSARQCDGGLGAMYILLRR